jgi:hypothetical protein
MRLIDEVMKYHLMRQAPLDLLGEGERAFKLFRFYRQTGSGRIHESQTSIMKPTMF